MNPDTEQSLKRLADALTIWLLKQCDGATREARDKLAESLKEALK